MGAIFFMYVAVIKEDGTVLKERKGKYYVIQPATPGDIISFSGVDSMHLFDREYMAKTSYPTDLRSIMVDCCLDCGVNMGFEDFPNSNYIVKNKPTDCTYREIISWVAQIAGTNLRVNSNDSLEFVWYGMENATITNLDGGNYMYSESEIRQGANKQK